LLLTLLTGVVHISACRGLWCCHLLLSAVICCFVLTHVLGRDAADTDHRHPETLSRASASQLVITALLFCHVLLSICRYSGEALLTLITEILDFSRIALQHPSIRHPNMLFALLLCYTILNPRCSGETLLTLITDILDFSRIEANKLVLSTAVFSLQTVVEAAMEIAGLRAAQKRLQVRFLSVFPFFNVFQPVLGHLLLLACIAANKLVLSAACSACRQLWKQRWRLQVCEQHRNACRCALLRCFCVSSVVFECFWCFSACLWGCSAVGMHCGQQAGAECRGVQPANSCGSSD
jgi:hypothetical protein